MVQLGANKEMSLPVQYDNRRAFKRKDVRYPDGNIEELERESVAVGTRETFR